MTDREKLLKLLEEFGIEPFISDNSVSLLAHHGKVVGYSGFVAEFEFDESGKFGQVGIWE